MQLICKKLKENILFDQYQLIMFMKHLSLFNEMIWDIIQIMGLHENILILLKSSSMVVYISSVMKLTTFGKSSFPRLGNDNGYLFPINNLCIVWLGNENECIISEPCIDSYLLCSALDETSFLLFVLKTMGNQL